MLQKLTFAIFGARKSTYASFLKFLSPPRYSIMRFPTGLAETSSKPANLQIFCG